MRVTGPDLHPHRQRRRRYAAAVLCLGTLAAAALGTFLTEQSAVRSHGSSSAGDVAGGTNVAGAMPSPQPLGSQPVAYPLGPSGVVGTAQRATQRPTSSGTAGPATVSPVPEVGDVGTTGPATDGAGSSGGGAGSGGGGGNVALFAGKAPDGGSPLSSLPSSSPSSSSSMTVSDPLTSSAFAGMSQVGAIFDNTSGTPNGHFCTGSVVDSPSGDIVVTAAHCVYDSSAGTYLNSIAFVPGYHDGQQPYGIWTPSKILVPQQWIDSGDPDYDVAFMVVHQAGSSDRIQDQVGADELGLNPDYTSLVQVVGYPDTTEQPVTCTNYTKQLSPTQLEFDCPGFPDGTSGGPFLADVDQQTGRGTVLGVIGGYETGGDTPDVSYSVYFSAAVADLFSQAEAAG